MPTFCCDDASNVLSPVTAPAASALRARFIFGYDAPTVRPPRWYWSAAP